jgi:hypothetical protein
MMPAALAQLLGVVVASKLKAPSNARSSTSASRTTCRCTWCAIDCSL